MMELRCAHQFYPKHSRRDRPIAGGIHRRRRPPTARDNLGTMGSNQSVLVFFFWPVLGLFWDYVSVFSANPSFFKQAVVALLRVKHYIVLLLHTLAVRRGSVVLVWSQVMTSSLLQDNNSTQGIPVFNPATPTVHTFAGVHLLVMNPELIPRFPDLSMFVAVENIWTARPRFNSRGSGLDWINSLRSF